MSAWSDVNKARVRRAEHALRFYLKYEHDPGIILRVILSDLQHYCDAYGVNFTKLSELASADYMVQVLAVEGDLWPAAWPFA
jgi:hypothetical protein